MKLSKIIAGSAAAALTASCIPYAVYADDAVRVRVIVENTTYTAETAPWSGTLLDTWVEIGSEDDINSAVKLAVENSSQKITVVNSDWGAYISSIGDLAEYDGGSSSGWSLFLNDWSTNEGASAYSVSNGKLQDGDEITMRYTCAWGADLGTDWSSTSTLLKDLKFSSGSLDKPFDPKVTDYTLTVDDYSDDIYVTPTAENKIYQTRVYKNTYTPENAGSEYKRSQAVNAVDGDKIYIGVGEPSWAGSSADLKSTVYTVTVVSNKLADDKSAAEEADKLIAAIGDVTAESGEAIKAARTAYDRLTDEQKALCSNYDILTAAEKAYAELTKTEPVDFSFGEIYSEVGKYLLDGSAPSVGSVGGEWTVIGLARSGIITDAFAEGYYANAVKYVKTVGSVKLSNTKSTDNSRMILALNSLGYDASDIAGFDLYAPLEDTEYVSKQGINGAVWALIAFDSAEYDTAVRGELKEMILSAQLSDGSWSLDGKTSDVDMTAMALTALAPYYSEENVKTAANKAIEWLSSVQNSDGSFSTAGSATAESTAQVLTALSAYGIDGAEDARFIKDGNSVCSALADYYLGDGVFAHVKDSQADRLATEQAYYAMAAYYRMLADKNVLFDMTDVEAKAAPTVEPSEEPSDEPSEVPSDEPSEKPSAPDASSSEVPSKDEDKSPATGSAARGLTAGALIIAAAFTAIKRKDK